MAEEMTDKELSEQLKRHGLPVGPITVTTRPIYEKKLNKKLHHHEPAKPRPASSGIKRPLSKRSFGSEIIPGVTASTNNTISSSSIFNSDYVNVGKNLDHKMPSRPPISKPARPISYAHQPKHKPSSASPHSISPNLKPNPIPLKPNSILSRPSPIPLKPNSILSRPNPILSRPSPMSSSPSFRSSSSPISSPKRMRLSIDDDMEDSFTDIPMVTDDNNSSTSGVLSGVIKIVQDGVKNVQEGMKNIIGYVSDVVPSNSRSFQLPISSRQQTPLRPTAPPMPMPVRPSAPPTPPISQLPPEPVVPLKLPTPSSDHNLTEYDWELQPTDVQICLKQDGQKWKLGQGGFGEVFKGIKDGVDEVAIKVIPINSTEAVDQFKTEIDLISKLRHRNILQFYGACIKPNHFYMVTELMKCDLFSALRKDFRYTWRGTYGKQVILDIATGLNYLHSLRPPVVHRDIKSPNILLSDNIVKIADVGVAKVKLNSDMTAQRGFTIAWAAPEVIYRRRATEKIDIWSLGIILWEVVTRQLPGPGLLQLPYSTSKELKDLYSSCIMEDYTLRPSAAEIIICLKTM